MRKNNLVLSIFPGIDLLGRAFEEEGFCIVRGPDVLWGGDIRNFHPPAGVFEGVIGGPPCQIFSRLKYLNPLAGEKHGNLIPEFERVVAEARPLWWLSENVIDAPESHIDGYYSQRIILDNRWVNGVQQRKRLFCFGCFEDKRLDIDVCLFEQPLIEKTITASGGLARMKVKQGSPIRRGDLRPPTVLAGHGPVGRGGEKWSVTPPIPDICELQGLPRDFLEDSPFTTHGKRQVIGNGVPMSMGRAIAKAVREATGA